MSSDDGSQRQPAPPRPGPSKPRLNVAGDLPAQANHDRVSTVMIYAEDPTPPPGHGPSLAQHDPEETFPPGATVPAQSLTGQHNAAHLQQGSATGQHNAAHLQQGFTGQHNAAHLQQGFATGQHNAAHLQQGHATGQHNAAHLQQGSATGQHNAAHLQQGFTGQHNAAHLQQGFTGQHNAAHLQQGYASQSAHDAEHLTNTGFIPAEAFKAARAQQQAAAGKKPARARRVQIGGRTFEIPSFGMNEIPADAKQRVIYSICATMAGGLIGFVLGAFNARLQGWTVSEGTAEMHLLAMVCALTFGIMAYMRPQQVDQVLVKIGLLSAADADPDRTDELRIR
ncbi:hypothetical protein FRC98_12350 [Lujinxingia vulgaris]|uniref:Uncharacterized protein n=1 Tax=Lujinxingia vulgaris TaxID=2600176 RepID=A0A5C6XGQ3_9DELT|nr:hypothetical protein [Lujinxingia vulgaris]TXD36621.1 hypothetical protein FRC98_12350 [Lujinxingia vulgaris]